ncbi:MAG: SDR family oxidoreductase [Acidimicrobiales bacterium]
MSEADPPAVLSGTAVRDTSTAGAMDASGLVGVVTGASRGIGAAIVEVFLGAGMSVGACARAMPAQVGRSRLFAQNVDVADHSAVSTFADATVQRFGRIDVWVNNAGVLGPVGPLRELDLGEIERHMSINVMGVLAGSAAFLRHLHSGARGLDVEERPVLVNISSGAAFQGYAGWSAYSAGKAAVERLTECIRLEEEPFGLRAYTVQPGVVATDMQAELRSSDPSAFPSVAKFLDRHAEGRLNSPHFVAERILEVVMGLAPESWQPAEGTEGSLRLPEERQQAGSRQRA